jgi:hypothetical protein
LSWSGIFSEAPEIDLIDRVHHLASLMIFFPARGHDEWPAHNSDACEVTFTPRDSFTRDTSPV